MHHHIHLIIIIMSNVGIPIKLLYEAEGMKVTVEVGFISMKYTPGYINYICEQFRVWCMCFAYPVCVCQHPKVSHGFRLSPPTNNPVQIYKMIWIESGCIKYLGGIWRDKTYALCSLFSLMLIVKKWKLKALPLFGRGEREMGIDPPVLLSHNTISFRLSPY